MTLEAITAESESESLYSASIQHSVTMVLYKKEIILEWTTSLDTSCRTLFVCVSGCRSTSRRVTSLRNITSDCY